MSLKRICLIAATTVVLLSIPASSDAQFNVRFGGGGNRGGYGGYRVGYYGGYPRGFNSNSWNRPGFSINLGSGFNYGNNWRGGYYPGSFGNSVVYPQYYGNSHSNVTYSNPDTIYHSGSVVHSPPISQPGMNTSGQYSLYPPTPSSISNVNYQDGGANIEVMVPANADLYWNGLRSTLSGEIRRFRTAPTGEGGSVQKFEARWTGSDGQPVSQTREVRVTSNGNFRVDFNRAESQQPENSKQSQKQSQTPRTENSPPDPIRD